jgi:Fungal trichothecene efflux pump (TRI12)
MNWRYIANSGLYAFTIPTNPLAPNIAISFQTQTSVKWRGCFYFMIAVNVLSVLCWDLFYHPPTYKMLHRRTQAKEMLLRFDWIGLILYTAGLPVFLTGLVWGRTLYPWKSTQVIGTVVAGAVGLVVFIL